MGRQKENDVGMPQTSQSPQLVEERQTEASRFLSVGILGGFFQKNLGDGDTIEIKIYTWYRPVHTHTIWVQLTNCIKIDQIDKIDISEQLTSDLTPPKLVCVNLVYEP